MRSEIQEAIGLLRSRDPRDLDRVLELIQQTVYSFSMKVCGHREDAEDTSQDVLLQANTHLPRLTDPNGLTTWLYTVAKNACLMRRRKSMSGKGFSLSLEDLMPGQAELEALREAPPASPERSYLRHEESERVRQAVLRIPPPYRLILVLHDMEELSTEEVGRITGLSVNTVRVRLHRARLFVRRELSAAKVLSNTSKRIPRRAPARAKNCRQMFAALSDYVDQRLADSMCAEFEKHMAGCDPCQAFVRDLQQTIREVKSYKAATLDPRAAAAIRRVILQKYLATLKRTKAVAQR